MWTHHYVLWIYTGGSSLFVVGLSLNMLRIHTGGSSCYAAYSYCGFIIICCRSNHYRPHGRSFVPDRLDHDQIFVRRTRRRCVHYHNHFPSIHFQSTDLTANNYEPVLCNNKNIIRSDRPTAYDERVSFRGPAYNGESLHH